jgi:hypothetical protein
LSLLIGIITLFPLISTTFVMIIFSACKYASNIDGDQMTKLSCLVTLFIFCIGSNHIYRSHFAKIDFNNTLISLSAVFGLYRFPLAGVFYGPLVILIFRCAYDALGRSKVWLLFKYALCNICGYHIKLIILGLLWDQLQEQWQLGSKREDRPIIYHCSWHKMNSRDTSTKYQTGPKFIFPDISYDSKHPQHDDDNYYWISTYLPAKCMI